MAHPPGGDGKGHKKKHAHAAKHEDHAAVDAPFWFISWADLVTLLFGLFVALFSISNLSETKLKEFLSGIKANWGSGGEGQSALEALKQGKTQIIMPRQGNYFKGDQRHPGPSPEQTLVPGKDRSAKDIRPGSRLIRGGKIQFPASGEGLTEAARTELLQIATALRGYRSKIDIRGYATGTELGSADVSEAWDLAYKRAKRVADFLTDPEHGNLLANRLRIVVGGPVDPISVASDENQRVEIVDTEEFTHFPWQSNHYLYQQWLAETNRSTAKPTLPAEEMAKLDGIQEGMQPTDVEKKLGSPLEKQRYSFADETFEEWRYAGGVVRFFVHGTKELGTVVTVGKGKAWRFTE